MLQKISGIWVKSMSLLLLTLILLHAGVASQTGPIQHQLSERDLEEIEEFIKKTQACYGITGLTATIVQNDKVLMAKAFGDVDVEKGEKATSKTAFCIGSLSKGFTSTLLAMQLAKNKGSINWDTPLHCLPKSDIAFSDDIRSSQANLRDLLSHKLGVPSYFNPLYVGFPAKTTRHEMSQRIRFMEPVEPFRSRFMYNNYMYGLAGYVAELLADGESWEQLVRDKIFEPAGMTSSGFIDETGKPAGLAQPYVYVNQTLYKVDTEVARTVHPLGPAGSIYSTAEDMAKWIQLHLAVISRYYPTGEPPIPFPGNMSLSHDELLRVWETYQAQMPEPSLTEPLMRPRFPISDMELSYAMGWERAIYRGYLKLYHTGGISTYISLIQLLPTVRAGMFFSTSGPGGAKGGKATRTIAAFVTDKILGETPWLNHTTSCTFPAPWSGRAPERPKDQQARQGDGGTRRQYRPSPLDTPISPNPEGSYPLSTFSGTYSHMGFGTMVFYEEEGSLYMRYGRIGRGILKETSVDGFFYCTFLDKLWYLSNQDGGRVNWALQFTYLMNGKTQTLLIRMDPSILSRFERGLDIENIPPHKREDPDLYVCPKSQTFANGASKSARSMKFILLSLFFMIQNIASLW